MTCCKKIYHARDLSHTKIQSLQPFSLSRILSLLYIITQLNKSDGFCFNYTSLEVVTSAHSKSITLVQAFSTHYLTRSPNVSAATNYRLYIYLQSSIFEVNFPNTCRAIRWISCDLHFNVCRLLLHTCAKRISIKSHRQQKQQCVTKTASFFLMFTQ